ncbi:hypothetical protein L211DRAFT_829254 [Terfezia boudieri ATCC MYA-4762]|uniref:Uncharacterized protein n=1 Tax=Terfezia boudieri ATCC MYA-4762 TaxID=1051890 RepID=A0A3N4LIN1_9PEZI|nr:hypothetical protein L211DRAFT_829254 [Terfezia boudieri ATCC MYA-4762]
MSERPNVILYHYPFSPYARKVFWYLRLRSIPFTQCIQPPILPRPDLSTKLGITYRRIPVCAIDKDIYCDTSLILKELGKRFPFCITKTCGVKDLLADASELGAGGANVGVVIELVENWANEVFVVAGRLLPGNLPLLKDEKFLKDRGRYWAPGAMSGTREEALASMRRLFHAVETIFLGGGKKWILSGDKPTVADLMAIWPLDWVTTIPNALSLDPTIPTAALITPTTYPLTFAWISRFQSLCKSLPPGKTIVPTLTGQEAKENILAATAMASELGVDEDDPLGLKKGEMVEVVPTDSGVLNPQRGRLLGLGIGEVVLEVDVPNTGGKVVRVHFPRRNYRITRVEVEGKANL